MSAKYRTFDKVGAVSTTPGTRIRELRKERHFAKAYSGRREADLRYVISYHGRNRNAPMKYEEIIAGFVALQASDFDHMNVDARGLERLSELTDALMNAPGAEKAIPELFGVMERLPTADLGSPGPLVHTLERLHGYEAELVRSIRRQPSLLSVWMVNRILNTHLSEDNRESYMALLHEVATHPSVPDAVREDAHGFVAFQKGKTQST